MRLKLLTPMSIIVVALCAGCSSEPPKNAAGPEAKTGKTYSADDANAAQPKRGGSDAK